MINSNIFTNNSSTSQVKAKVELYNGSTLVKTCTCSDVLQGFTLGRVGDNTKFFGYGICQKLNVSLIDLMRELTVTTANTIEVGYLVGSAEEHPHPAFSVTEVNRAEDTNTLSITAYDALYKASAQTIAEVALPPSYTIREAASICAIYLGLSDIEIVGVGADETCFDTSYEAGANFDGSEKIRDVLNAIAEATQTIYYINNNNKLVFKRFDIDGAPALTISRDDYFSMHTQTNRRLTAICSATELGDNVEASTGETGTTQYVRDNPFWELREDVGTLVDNALAAVGGLTINQFDCSWTGNFLLEIGDKIELITEDGGSVFSYVMVDSLGFDGTLEQFTEWAFEDSEGETSSNPTNLGEALNKTFAKVDKAAKQVDIVASEVSGYSNSISALQVNTESISASVKTEADERKEATEALQEEIAALSQEVSLRLTKDEVVIAIESELSDGVNKVKTGTGFTFDDQGLLISKTDSEITTQITEDGMTVDRQGETVLEANNEGVRAEDLHATTWLIIGNNSRLEDYNGNRTACFWIGG